MKISMKATVMAMLMAATMALSFSTYATTDDEDVTYTAALREGNVKLVKKMLDNGLDINRKFFAWSALQVAANKNQFKVVKLLVERGVDINYQHPMTKMTALHFAAYDNNKEMVKYLIDKGADKNLKMRGGVSIVRAMLDDGNKDMADYLLSEGVLDDGCQEEKCL